MFNFRVFIPCFVFSISIIPFDVTAQDELVFRDGFERCELAGKVPVDAIRWGGGGDGASWSDVLNWEGGVLPGNGDLVSIRVEGDVTVIYDSSLGTTSIKTLDSCESLTVSGGTLQLNDDSRVKANLSLSGGTVATATSLTIGGSLQHSGGILTGAGTVTVAGVITWTGGNQSGSGETIANGGVTMTNSNDKVLISRTLTLKGDTVWAGDVRMRDAATINSHAAFDIQTDHPIGDIGGALSSFYNYGMLTEIDDLRK